MKILYDHQVFTWQKFGGISRYFFELMRHSSDLFEYDVSGIYSENEYMRQLVEYKNFPIESSFRGKSRAVGFINKLNSIKKLKQGNYDVFHPTYYDPYALRYKKNSPMVIDVHDMIYEKFPSLFSDADNTISNKKKFFEKADVIIATSQNTKKDLLNIYPNIPENKINVIYRGKIFEAQEKKEKNKCRYILFTGQRDRYKNFDKFIQAVAPLLIRYDLQLFCTGSPYTSLEMDLLRKNNIANRAVCRFMSDVELQDAYEKAVLFVFPSLYEGFGLPILEAFASGCPAALSNSSCFPEIAGNAAIYFDPNSVESIRKTVEEVLLDNALQSQMIENGYIRLKEFSWDKAARQTYELYSNI